MSRKLFPFGKASLLDKLSFESSIDDVISDGGLFSSRAKTQAFHFVNAYSLALASKSDSYIQVLSADFLYCDGKPLSKYLSRSRTLVIPQVRGADFLRKSISQMNETTVHFFLGSTEKVLNALMLKAQQLNPKIVIGGAHSPKFDPDYTTYLDEWSEMIESSKSNCVWVGLGTPKQDFVAHELAKRLNVRVFAVGAAFGYVSEVDLEAPAIFKFLYLEWLYRLFKEPKRLVFRYLWGNSQFICILLRDIVKNSRKDWGQ